MTKIKPQNVQRGMRIRVFDDDGSWVEGIAESETVIHGYSRNKVFSLAMDLVKPYSDDSTTFAIEPKHVRVGIHCKCFLVE